MVIQRWQTVLLLIVAVIMGVFTFSSLGTFEISNEIKFTTIGIESPDTLPENYSSSTLYFFVLSLLTAALSFINIFTFKNLSLQKKLCWINIILLLSVIVVTAIVGYMSIPDTTITWSAIVVSPILSIILLVLSYKLISSDEKKLRSYDRIR